MLKIEPRKSEKVNIIPKKTRHKRDIEKKPKNYIIGNSIKDALDKYKPFNLKGTDMHKGKIYLVTNPLRLEHEDLKYKLWLGSYSNSILRNNNRDLTKSESNLYKWCKFIYMDIFNKIYKYYIFEVGEKEYKAIRGLTNLNEKKKIYYIAKLS